MFLHRKKKPTKKMKVTWDATKGAYATTDYVVTLTGLCPDGTKLVVEYPVKCDKISDPLVKYYIYTVTFLSPRAVLSMMCSMV